MREPLHDRLETDVESVTIPTHLWEFAQNQSDLRAAAEDLRGYLEDLSRLASITVHSIETRAKTLTSYGDKAAKTKADGTPKYTNPLQQINDRIAARIIVFTMRERNDFANLIASTTEVTERLNPGAKKYNGYDSEHLVVIKLKDEEARERYGNLAQFLDGAGSFEVQVRSVAAHAWAEYEHDVRYKSGAFQELDESGRKQIDQWFVEAGGLRRFMDELFSRIDDLLLAGKSAKDPVVDEKEAPGNVGSVLIPTDTSLTEARLLRLVEERFPTDVPGSPQSVQGMLKHLDLAGISTVNHLTGLLLTLSEGEVSRLMDYPGQTTGIRKLDDEILAILALEYIDAADSDDRRAFLQLRLKRLHGKFAIYSLREDGMSTPPMTAAKAVRELVKMVGLKCGPGVLEIDSAVSLDEAKLLPSQHARPVGVGSTTVYVISNLSRAWAESIMLTLLNRAPASGLEVLRAGDRLFRAPESDPDPYALTTPLGTVTFKYENNDGKFTLGAGDAEFTLSVSPAGVGSIYGYNDPSNIKTIGLMKGVPRPSDVADANSVDVSSRSRLAYEGDAFILQNVNGYWAVICIERVDAGTEDFGAEPSLTFTYAIQMDKGTDFRNQFQSD